MEVNMVNGVAFTSLCMIIIRPVVATILNLIPDEKFDIYSGIDTYAILHRSNEGKCLTDNPKERTILFALEMSGKCIYFRDTGNFLKW